MIPKITRNKYGQFLFCRWRCSGGAISRVTLIILVALLAACPMLVTAASPDPVLEWIGIMNDTVIAGGTNPLLSNRLVALVSSSVFDSVNGIDPHFRPLHVKPDAPRDASRG